MGRRDCINRISLVVNFLVSTWIFVFPDKPCKMRPGFSTAYASRRVASGEEAMSSSGHRLVPPKKSVTEEKSLRLETSEPERSCSEL